MAVFKATKNKRDTSSTFKATSQRSYDSTMVYDWETKNKEAITALNQYRDRINSGGFMTADDLTAYRSALDNYVDSSTGLRRISSVFGGNSNRDDNDKWSAEISSMESGYESLSQYYSQWKTEEDYNSWLEQQKDYEEKSKLDLDAYGKEIAELEAQRASMDLFSEQGVKNFVDYVASGGSIDELESLIQEKKLYLENAKRIQEGVALSGVADPESENYDPDFERYTGYASTEYDSWWDKAWSQYGMGYEDLTYEYINNQNGIRDEIKNKYRVYSSDTSNPFSDGESSLEEEGYDYMTEDQVAIYNYYYAKDGKEAAEKYLDTIREALHYQKAEGMYENMEDKTILELAFGVAAGLDQFESGMEGIFNAVTGNDAYVPASATQMASGMVREDLADEGFKILGNSLGQIGYDAVTTTTNMLPSILTSTVVGAINPVLSGVAGSALLGASASGNAYQQMLNLGYDKGQARSYAALVGGSEAGLQYLLGGIGKLGGKLSGNAVSKLLSGVDNALARTAIKLGGNMLSEGFEEGLQEILTPWFKNLATGVHSEDINWSEAAYSSLLGALTAGILEGGGTVSGEVNTYKTGRALQGAGISAQRLSELGETFSADTVAYQLAGRVDENTGAYTLGRLFNEIGAELTEANKADVARELESRGVSAKDAKVMVDAMAAVVVGEEFTDQQIAMLDANDVLTKAYIDVIVNPNSTVNQRSQGYNQVLMDLAKEKTSAETAAEAGDKITSPEGNLTTEKKTGSESHYEAAVEGKTIHKATGEAVSIKEVASVGDGKMTLRLEDGSEVDSKEIAYSNAGEAYVFETVANLGVDAVDATRIINAFRNSGVEGKAFADGMKLAFEYGYGNFSQQELSQKEFAGNIPRMYTHTAYEIGQKMRQQDSRKQDSEKDITKIRNITKDIVSSYGQNPKSNFLRDASMNSIRNPDETVNKKVSGKAGGVYYTTKDGKVLSVSQAEKNGKLALKDKQSVAVKTAKFLQKLGLGGNYYFFESYVDEKGNRVFKDRFGRIQTAPNGLYYADGDIYIDINAGSDSNSITLRTLAHELTHMIQQWSAAKYKVMADFLAEQYDKEGRNAYEAAKAKQAELSKLRGKTVPFREAYHEFVADSMSTLFDDGNLYGILTDLKAKDKTLFDYIKKFFDGLAAKVRKLYANARAETDEGQFVQGLSKDTIYRLQQMFAEALVEASENYAEKADTNYNNVMDEAVIKYEKEDLAQVNPQLYKWLRTFNAMSSNDNVTHPDLEVKKNSDRTNAPSNRELLSRALEGVMTADASENHATSEQKNTDTKIGVQYSVTAEMTDAERYESLKNKSLAVITQTATPEHSEEVLSLEALKKKAKSKAEKIIYPLADKLGITKKQLSHEDIDVEFIFSKNGGLKESLSKQLRYGGNYADFARAMVNLDRVLDSAILIEIHGDKYAGTSRADENLEAVYVLLGAFQDGANIIPVQMEIKKSSDAGGRLYMTVALTKIEADVLGSTPEKVQTRSLIPASSYSLSDIVREINPEDAHFLKYLPDDMLSSAQMEAKNRALAEDIERIGGYRKEKINGIRYQDRTATTSNRELLAQALEGAVTADVSENHATGEQKNTDTKIGVQYSFGEQSAQSAQSDITAKYKKIVDNVINGTHTDKSAVLLGYTPETYREMGMPSLPFVIGVGHIYSIAKTEAEAILENRHSKKMNYHGLGSAAVKNIYEATKDPIMVIAAKDVNPRSSPLRSTHSIVAIVDVGLNGEHLLLPVEITAKRTVNGEEMDVNVLSSAYNKKVSELVREAVALENIGEVGVYYIKKGATLPADSGVQFPIHLSKKIASGGIIHKFSEKVNMNISDQTQSRQFKRWFGDWQNDPENASKVVNADGTPKVVYHGTSAQFNIFSSRSGEYWFSEYEDYAESMMEERGGGEVKAVYLNMRNPYRAKLPPGQFSDPGYEAKILRDAKAAHHDGVIIENDTTNPLEAETFYVVFSPEQIKSATDNIGTFDGRNPDIRYQDRTATPSNRELLSQALEGVVTDVEDFHSVKEYRRIVPLLDAEEAKLSRLNAQIREMSFGKGKRDTAKLSALRLEARQTENRIDVYDKQLLRLEAAAPLQRVLEREKAKAYKRAEQKGKEAVQKEKERAQAKYDELAARNAASRKKAVEGRRKTEMRHKIKDVVNELNQYLLKGTKDRHVPVELQKAVAEALDAVNMDTVGAEERIAKLKAELMNAKTPERIQEISRKIDNIQAMGDRINSRLQSLKDAYDRFADSDDPLIANSHDDVISAKLESVIESVGNTPLRDMTLAQLEDVYDMYRMMLTAIRNANRAFKAKKSEDIAVISNRVLEELDRVGKKKPYRLKGTESLENFDWNNLKPVYAFERVGSGTLSEIFNNVRSGEDTWATDVTEAREYFLEKSRKYNYDSWDFDKRYKFTSSSGMDFALSLEQIMSLYAYSKRDQAAEHLRRGGIVFDKSTEVTMKTKLGIKAKFNPTEATAYNISDDTLADMIGKLTKEQKGFADEMQEYLSSTMGAKGNEVSLELYGIKLFKEKFYFPLKSAQQFMAKAKEQQQGDARIKNSGFSKETVRKAGNPIVLTPFMDVWASHVNEMSMYHAFVLPMEDFYRVYNYKTPTSETMATVSVQQFIQNAHNSEAPIRYIDQLLKDLNGGARSDPRESLSKALMSKFKKASVMASVSVVVQQPTAIVRAMALVDARHFGIAPITRGVVRTVNARKHKALWAEVKKYAPVAVIKEMGYFDTNMGMSTQEFIKAKEYDGIGQKAKALFTDSNYRDEKLSRLPALADEMAWVAIWEAVKRETVSAHKELRPGSEEFLKAVGERFTEVVTKTQVYDSILARSGNMRSKTAFMNMWTSFMAEPTTSINMIQDALRKGKRGDRKYAAKAIGAVYGSVILNAALVSLVYAMRDDDEDETFKEKYLSRLVTEILDGTNPLTYIPFLKDVWSVMQGFDIDRADMSLITDLVDSLQQAVKVMATDTDDMDEEELAEHQKKVSEMLWSLADNMASLTGIPLKNVRRDFRGVKNLFVTLAKDSDGRQTTAGSLLDVVIGDVKASTPVWGWLPDKSKSDKLYDAIVNGDTAYVERLKSGYRDESSYNTAVRKALRDNDPRIKEAAQAVVDGNTAERVRIVREMVAEGRFSIQDIQAAINAEIDKLRKKAKGK